MANWRELVGKRILFTFSDSMVQEGTVLVVSAQGFVKMDTRLKPEFTSVENWYSPARLNLLEVLPEEYSEKYKMTDKGEIKANV